MKTLKEVRDQRAAAVREALLNHPEKSWEQIAIEFGVSRSFVQNRARRLKAKIGFGRKRGPKSSTV